MAFLPELSSQVLSAAPPIQTQLVAEIRELKTMLQRATAVIAQISERIDRLERQL
jgi:hypothetical protein